MAIAKEKTMNILASVKDMDRTQWLLTRRLGIGGSDAGIIMGLNQYKTAFELWLDKTDQVLPDESAGEAAYWGNQMEEVVAKEFEKRTGKKVRRSNMMYQHPEHDFMLANVDRFVVGEDAILECKTASAYLAKEWEADEVPATYLVQIQHYLAVTGKSKAYVAVLIGGNKFIWKEIDRDEELINQIIAFELDFWETNVKGQLAPALDGSSAAEKYLKDRFAKSEDKQIILPKTFNEYLTERANLERDIKLLETRKKEIDNNIKGHMESAEKALSDNYEVSWKSMTSKRVDTKKLKEKFSDIYLTVLMESHSRKFTVKEIK
ncbi:YqaJ viral recombinase family protein [Listeria monocytogenes]|uniref:YqaJ viral recombinase family nuclease n=1 Tax=Listeria monocytogenes TaxID=1639 RepID=UPI00190A3D47|nr:YqaJ viral recombinase family protein [Listeria monocytogenes]MBK3700140.1 YqaJ viral recombinase family protein [Listeria monocytogenes]WIW15631.1 YqaJ viral recombinase family protein [Listeria monocytogenes]WIW18532.1 YqaJ viral recombinase family protein [Listeria monocytogenes]WKN68252.1 YqaJ viral recombinase family protein [Listeria monocytogenes]HDB3920274.1 YqaJ viral recombinase family protein [Listeria monocytogenes]